jgi:c-di-GMP-related signal transduction protein
MVPAVDIHVARQPIFDRKLNIFAYELLFRNDFVENCNSMNNDQVTNEVISNSFLQIGIDTLTSGKKAFINFTSTSLKNNIPAILPKEFIAVEILEDVVPDEEIIKVCKDLKEKGYVLVLDDFLFKPEYLPLVELVDIIKIDFRITSFKEQQEIIHKLNAYSIKFLAEKIETQEEFQRALTMGYSYFQGYFFCKPSIISRKKLSSYKTNHLQLLQELHKQDLDFNKIEMIIRQDVSMSYKLLKFINSSIFGFRMKINSLHQALTLLGQKELFKWISIITLKGIGSNKPCELILSSLIRARFAEKLAADENIKVRSSDAFLMGMFSHIDALLGRPLDEILEEISLSEEIIDALLNKESNQFSILYNLIKNYEKGNWEAYSNEVKKLEIDEYYVLKSYRESLIWVNELLRWNAE